MTGWGPPVLSRLIAPSLEGWWFFFRTLKELRALVGARPERLSARSAESAFSQRETCATGEESVYSEGAAGDFMLIPSGKWWFNDDLMMI